jgi:tRNA pseudouridine55 synthase
MDGILNINKPAGITSFGVVSKVRHCFQQKRVGHAGTLDPSATGVLPVCLGKATRITEYFMELQKTYRAEIELGIATDTGDADGKVVERGDASVISINILTTALDQFKGIIEQTPPMFSALKYHGRPLYELARAGVNVERRTRKAEIFDLRLLSWVSPVASIEVTCSRGTYIRSLADDLGKSLSCGAHLKNLIRLRYGPFKIHDSVSLSQLEELSEQEDCLRLIQPLDSVLLHWPAVVLDAEAEQDIRHGRPLSANRLPDITHVEEKIHCRAYNLDGHFVGVLLFNFEESQWQPEKVFI